MESLFDLLLGILETIDTNSLYDLLKLMLFLGNAAQV